MLANSLLDDVVVMVAAIGVALVGVPVILQTILAPTATRVGGVGEQALVAQLGNPVILHVALLAALVPLLVQAIVWLYGVPTIGAAKVTLVGTIILAVALTLLLRLLAELVTAPSICVAWHDTVPSASPAVLTVLVKVPSLPHATDGVLLNWLTVAPLLAQLKLTVALAIHCPDICTALACLLLIFACKALSEGAGTVPVELLSLPELLLVTSSLAEPVVAIALIGMAEFGVPDTWQLMLSPALTALAALGAHELLAQVGKPLIAQLAFCAVLIPLLVHKIVCL